MNTTILGFLTNNIFVGYFNFSMELYQISLPFVTSMGIVILPQMVVAFERGNVVEYNNLLDKLVSFNFIISLPIAVFIFLFSNDLILFLTDRRYLPAVISTQILAPLIIIVGFSNILMLQVLNIMRLEKYMLFTVITGAVISLLANYILIPLYFHVGAAIATLLSELIVSISLIYFVYRKTSIRINFRIVFCCMISLIPYFILFYFLSSKINNFIAKSIMINVGGLTAYILLLHYLFKQELVLLILNRIMLKIR
jgi:O-antigen/teichoic acid export membrane protein